MSGREMAAAFGLVAWAGFGLPCLIVPFIVPVPAVLLVVGILLTLGESALIARAVHCPALSDPKVTP
jgi:hypothetical protein